MEKFQLTFWHLLAVRSVEPLEFSPASFHDLWLHAFLARQRGEDAFKIPSFKRAVRLLRRFFDIKLIWVLGTFLIVCELICASCSCVPKWIWITICSCISNCPWLFYCETTKLMTGPHTVYGGSEVGWLFSYLLLESLCFELVFKVNF